MNFLKTYAVYFKLAAIAALVLLAIYITWDYRDAKAERDRVVAEEQARRDREEAVTDRTREDQKALEAERRNTRAANDRADNLQGQLTQSLQKIKLASSEIRTILTREIADHPTAYNQPLPEKGYEQWQKARALITDP